MRATELDQRLATGERGHHRAAALLGAATEGGHSSIGWPEAGRIEPGAVADLVTVGLDSVRLAGVGEANALEAVVFGASGADVRSVVASGRLVVDEGRHVEMDVAGELRGAIAAVGGGGSA
jgi:cytosine/adenosine deaminase-related metal-dependent hydrolase